MKVEIFEDIDTEDSNKLYVFDDNDFEVGNNKIRSLKNTIGLKTKKGPSSKLAAFYSDKDLDLNKEKILDNILNIKYLALKNNNKTIALYKKGYSKDSKIRSPKTYEYTNELLKSHFMFDNETGDISYVIPGHDEIIKAISIIISSVSINSIEFGKKIAFTSEKKYKKDQVIVFDSSVETDKSRLICRVIDSYDIKKVKDYWKIFENSEDSCIDSRDDLYQTHFEFIYSVGENGKIKFKNSLLTNQEKEESIVGKVLGQPIKVEKRTYIESKNKKYKIINKKTFKELLIEIGIRNYKSNLITDKSRKYYKKWEVVHNNIYYYFDFKKGIINNKLKLIFISNKSL